MTDYQIINTILCAGIIGLIMMCAGACCKQTWIVAVGMLLSGGFALGTYALYMASIGR